MLELVCCLRGLSCSPFPGIAVSFECASSEAPVSLLSFEVMVTAFGIRQVLPLEGDYFIGARA